MCGSLALVAALVVGVSAFASLSTSNRASLLQLVGRITYTSSRTSDLRRADGTLDRTSKPSLNRVFDLRTADDLGEFGRNWGGSPLQSRGNQTAAAGFASTSPNERSPWGQRPVTAQRVSAEDRVANGAIVIEAISHNGAWRFRYGVALPGGGARKFESFNSLRLPLDVDVRLLVTSLDNVCSFSVPELNLKRIAVPELVYKLDFRTDRTGGFRIEPDTLCGAGRLVEATPGWMTVVSRSEYEQWFESRLGAGR